MIERILGTKPAQTQDFETEEEKKDEGIKEEESSSTIGTTEPGSEADLDQMLQEVT